MKRPKKTHGSKPEVSGSEHIWYPVLRFSSPHMCYTQALRRVLLIITAPSQPVFGELREPTAVRVSAKLHKQTAKKSWLPEVTCKGVKGQGKGVRDRGGDTSRRKNLFVIKLDG